MSGLDDEKGVRTLNDAEYHKAKSEILAAVELARMQADDKAELDRITGRLSMRDNTQSSHA